DVLITNDDPQFSISVVSPVIESAGNAQFTITLSFAQSYTATIDYATQSLNAVAGTDYTSTSGTATFLPGETTKVILVPILNDYLFESSSDNFRLNISNAQNQTASMPMSIGTNFADVLISNDDPQISITSPSAITEAFTYQNFTVTLSAAQTYPVGVDYVAVGLSAMPGFDFTFSSCTQSLTFNPGETTKTIPIRILDDGYTEPNESYQVQLSNARNLNVNMPMSFLQSTANGTINDNDGAGCGSTILSLPVISGTTLYCPGTTLNLSVAAVPGATGYSWKGPNGYSASGTSISIPSVSATHSGIYTVRAYRPGGTVCDTSVGVSVNVAVVPCASTVSAKAYIEGYYLDSGKMAPVLFNHGEIDNTTITDSVYVDLHADTPPYTLVSTQKVALFTNGTILVTFPGITGSYYLAIRHSSAVETWSAVPVVLSAVPAVYDFSNALNKAFGDNLVQVDPGIYAFYNGDINQDQNIDLIDLSEMEIRIANFETCFLPTDLNGDGNTDLLDSPLLENNISLFVFSNHP
ncbi:MAG TPA: Calx-beta domain-containing protein, partial [Chitinophagaceae bacterium]|nr:Calx-beta domain-containing protein [Chitinophagaceae bacterium]